MTSQRFSILDGDEEGGEEGGDIELTIKSHTNKSEATPPEKSQTKLDNKAEASTLSSRAPLIALCFAMFANSFALMNPVPYCGYMILRFGLTKDKESVGYYAGQVMTAFMLGRFASSIYCGRLADRISRKFVIRISLWSCVIFQLLFGIAPNYTFALLARGAMGLFNGLAGVAKAALPELVPDAERQSAMGHVTNMWSLGMVAGPAVGGLLAERVFKSWPYLLPNAVGSLLALFAIVGIEIFLPGKPVAAAAYARLDMHEEGAEDADAVIDKAIIAVDTASDETSENPKSASCCGIPSASRLPVGLYSAYSFVTIAYDECYPLWLLSPKKSGGLAMHTGSIGTIMAATALGNSIAMFTVFPFLSKQVEAARLFLLACFACGFLALLPPAIALAMRSCPSIFLGRAFLIFQNILVRFGISCCYTSLFVCINDSSPPEIRGTVNGLAMSVASAFKAAGPTTGAAAFAWSLNSSYPPPLDEHFFFVFTSLACTLLALMASLTTRFSWRTKTQLPLSNSVS